MHPQTGKRERVYVNLRALYPDPDNDPGSEFSFEEVWAAKRGWLDRTWEDEEALPQRPIQAVDEEAAELVDLIEQVSVSEKLLVHHDVVMLDENGAVKDSREGKGKKKKVMEVNETQISACCQSPNAVAMPSHS